MRGDEINRMRTLAYLEDVNIALQTVYSTIDVLVSRFNDNDKYEKGFKHGLLTAKSMMTGFTDELTGEWIKDNSTGWRCSNCGKHIVLNIYEYGKFCPNCGIKMKKKEL